MRKLILLPLLLVLAACGSAAAPAATTVPQEMAPEESAGTDSADATASESENPAPAANAPVVIGATPAEAGVVRVQDHVKGAEEPVVTIIEYGDFQ